MLGLLQHRYLPYQKTGKSMVVVLGFILRSRCKTIRSASSGIEGRQVGMRGTHVWCYIPRRLLVYSISAIPDHKCYDGLVVLDGISGGYPRHGGVPRGERANVQSERRRPSPRPGLAQAQVRDTRPLECYR